MIVFTDNYTVDADTNLNAYPAGSPDYAMVLGAAADLIASGANKRVEGTIAGDLHARIIDAAGAITGDQEISGDCHAVIAGSPSGAVSARHSTTSADFYMSFIQGEAADEVRIYRVDAGTFVLVAAADRGITTDGTRRHRLRVTGAGATVNVEFQVDALSALTFADTSANRKTSGPPGVGMYTNAAGAVWVDNVTVDDLVAAADQVIHQAIYRGDEPCWYH